MTAIKESSKWIVLVGESIIQFNKTYCTAVIAVSIRKYEIDRSRQKNPIAIAIPKPTRQRQLTNY